MSDDEQTTPAADPFFAPRLGPTRGQTLVGAFMVTLLVGVFLASTAMVVACVGPSLCQDGGSASRTTSAPAGYGLRI